MTPFPFIFLQVNIYDINDNCPILANDSFSFEPIPALEIDPILSLSATDADSGDFAVVTFMAANREI